jgi:Flp pilus assembly protein TadD
MNCAQCGRPNQPGDKFCAYCGKPLAPARKFCTQCGAEIRPETRFCPQCGKPTSAGAGSIPSEPRPAPTETKLPPATPAPKPAPAAPVKLPPLRKIKEMYVEGAKEKARDLLAEYVKAKPKDSSAWKVLGDWYGDFDQDALAEEAYRTALALNPKDAGAYVGLGVLAREREDYSQALDYYSKAIELQPRSAAAWSSAAIVALRIGEDARAVEFAEMAWQIDNSEPKYAGNLAAAYHYAGRIKDRDRMYKEARRLKYAGMDALDKIFSGELTLRA